MGANGGSEEQNSDQAEGKEAAFGPLKNKGDTGFDEQKRK